MAARSRIHSLLDALLLVAFFGGISAPAAVHVVKGGDGEGTRMEYRNPAPLPELALDTGFPRRFTAYWNDNFALRTPLVRWHNALKLLVLNSSPSSSFVAGTDGWLYYTGERTIENHTGSLRFEPGDLERWRRILERRRRLCERAGALYLFVVVPDKHAIYPEHLPPAYRVPGVRTLYEDFMDYFAEHSDLRPIGLKEPLLAARETETLPLYYRVGTHWTDLGAWIGYERIMARIAETLPLEPLPRPEFVLDPEGTDDNFGSRLLIRDLMVQEIVSMRPRRPLRSTLVRQTDPPFPISVYEWEQSPPVPSVLMFHDSQGKWLRPYLADTFPRFVGIQKGAFNIGLIRDERPTVVIDQMGERRLWRMPLGDYRGGEEEGDAEAER